MQGRRLSILVARLLGLFGLTFAHPAQANSAPVRPYGPLDRPLVAADVLEYGTLPGWTLMDGALYWQWQDFEPDFDIQATIKNRYWLDLPQTLEQVMKTPPLSRERLLQVVDTLRTFYCGDCYIGHWIRWEDGRLSGEVAEGASGSGTAGSGPVYLGMAHVRSWIAGCRWCRASARALAPEDSALMARGCPAGAGG